MKDNRRLDVTVDLSHNNKDVDFISAQSDGITAVIHKSTQGMNSVDSCYEERSSTASNQGLLWGAYHFGESGNGADQARFYLDTIESSAGSSPAQVLLALDFETYKKGTIDKTMSIHDAGAFINTVEARTGIKPLLYGSFRFLERISKAIINDPELSDSVLWECALWLSRYTKVPNPGVPLGWSNFSLWQYTDGSFIPNEVKGIGVCDRNKFNGTEFDDLTKFWDAHSWCLNVSRRSAPVQ